MPESCRELGDSYWLRLTEKQLLDWVEVINSSLQTFYDGIKEAETCGCEMPPLSSTNKSAAGWICSECGKPCRQPKESIVDFSNRLPDRWKSKVEGKWQRFTLTTAHLDHNPSNCDRANLRALCAPCHLAYDAEHHAHSRQLNKRTVKTSSKITRPAGRWYGGKWILGKWIVNHLPAHKIYVEPFSGMWSVGLQKWPSETEVYNDLHSGAVNFWLHLRDNPKDLISLIESTHFDKHLREWASEPGGTPLEQALKFYAECLLSYTGGGTTWPGNSTARLQRPECNKHSHLWAIADRIKSIKIFNCDAFDIIRMFDGSDTLFYCDPCYLPETRTSPGRYIHDMSEAQHQQLAALLNQVQGKVVLSGYPSQTYRDYYSGWEQIVKETATNTSHKKASECLWIKQKDKSMPATLTAITLFSGFGLADVGLEQAGFQVVGAVEKSADIAEWHQINHPKCSTMIGSVSEFDYRQFSGIDLLHMSPPCQQYSQARSPNLPRHEGADAGLLALKAIDQTLPKFITLENVRGYLRADSYLQIKQHLWNLGYWLNEEVFDSADYGIPQSRSRLISRWIRGDALSEVPINTQTETLFGERYWDSPFPKLPRKSWYEAIADLIPLLPETPLASWQKKRLPSQIRDHLLISKQNSHPRSSTDPSFAICTGEPPRALLIRGSGQRGKNGIDLFWPDAQAPTIRTESDGCRQLSGWDQDYLKTFRLDPRCLARLQTVPDSFELPSKLSLATTGIGNGIPCEMMHQIASSFFAQSPTTSSVQREGERENMNESKPKLIIGTEKVKNPLQRSELHKKGLCDYVINVASGCLHGCTFCYVPSTPTIRFRRKYLQDKEVENPQHDWGKYLLTRETIAQQLEEVLNSKRTWQETPAGKGVVMLCSGTDPYQNNRTAAITRACVEVLLRYGKRVRILTRSPLWTKDLDILVNPLVTVGMSLPHLDNRLSRQIEPSSPLPSDRYQALQKGAVAGCRVFVAMAPTPPNMGLSEFQEHLSKLMVINPEVIFWEPINARGTNGTRMLEAGIEFVKDISNTEIWANNFIKQWQELNTAASLTGCQELLHIWPDRALEGHIDPDKLEHWWSRPTVEEWPQNGGNQMTTSTNHMESKKLTRYMETSGNAGDLYAPPGTRPWAIAIRSELHSCLHDAEFNAQMLRSWRDLMKQHAGYRQLFHGDGRAFGSYEEFCQAKPPFGLGYTPSDIDQVIYRRLNESIPDAPQVEILPEVYNKSSRSAPITTEEEIEELRVKAQALRAEAIECEKQADRLAEQMKDEILKQAKDLSQQIHSLMSQAEKISPDCSRQVYSILEKQINGAKSKEKSSQRNPLKWSTDDWRTPNGIEQPIVNLVKAALGGAIGLDPTADDNKEIPAQRHFTKADDCLQQDWDSPAATVFLQPPYSNPKPFLDKLFEQIDAGNVREAIILLPSRCLSNQGTGPALFNRTTAYCIWNTGRVAFLDGDGVPQKGANFDCNLHYLGARPDRFTKIFKQYGSIVHLNEPEKEISAVSEILPQEVWNPTQWSKAQRWKNFTDGKGEEFQCLYEGHEIYFLKDSPLDNRITGVAIARKGWVRHLDSQLLSDGAFATDSEWHLKQARIQVDRLTEQKPVKPTLKGPTLQETTSAATCKKRDGWYYPAGVSYKKARYCTNFDFGDGNAELPEVLEMRLYNRSKNRLEETLQWAIAEGFAISGTMLKKDDPLKKLSSHEESKLEGSLILPHPEALRIIADLDPKADPPAKTDRLGKLGELFFPGDRVGIKYQDDQYVVSRLIPQTEEKAQSFPRIFLTNARTGTISEESFYLTQKDNNGHLQLLEAAPNFANAYKPAPYSGLKVGDRVWLKEIPWADPKINISLSYWIRVCNDDPSIELRIAAFLDDGKVALYLTRQNGKPIRENAIVPPTALTIPDKNLESSPQDEDVAQEPEPSIKPEPSIDPQPSVTLNFPDTSQAKNWETWFSHVCNKKLNPDASVTRLSRSTSLQFSNLTELEVTLLKTIQLPKSPPSPKEAQEIWALAEKATLKAPSITDPSRKELPNHDRSTGILVPASCSRPRSDIPSDQEVFTIARNQRRFPIGLLGELKYLMVKQYVMTSWNPEEKEYEDEICYAVLSDRSPTSVGHWSIHRLKVLEDEFGYFGTGSPGQTESDYFVEDTLRYDRNLFPRQTGPEFSRDRLDKLTDLELVQTGCSTGMREEHKIEQNLGEVILPVNQVELIDQPLSEVEIAF